MSKLTESLRHLSLASLSLILGALGGGVGLIGVAVTERWMSPVYGVVLGVYVAAILAYHQLKTERDELDQRLTAIAASEPRFFCRGQKWVRLHSNGAYTFHALQLWIGNEPVVRTVASLAKNVSVRVAFYAEGSTSSLFALGSQWVDAIDPEAAGFTGRHQQIDIPANDNPAKFFLVLQHANTDDDCFAHSFGKLPGQPDGRHAAYRLRPGRYRVTVSLKGDNVEQELDLRFVNHGRAEEPEVIGIPKQHDAAQPSPAPDERDFV